MKSYEQIQTKILRYTEVHTTVNAHKSNYMPPNKKEISKRNKTTTHTNTHTHTHACTQLDLEDWLTRGHVEDIYSRSRRGAQHRPFHKDNIITHARTAPGQNRNAYKNVRLSVGCAGDAMRRTLQTMQKQNASRRPASAAGHNQTASSSTINPHVYEASGQPYGNAGMKGMQYLDRVQRRCFACVF